MTESKGLLNWRGEGAAAGSSIDSLLEIELYDISRMSQYTCANSKYDTPLESDAN